MIQVMRRLPSSSLMDEYEELMERLKDIALVGQVGSLLSWDQEVLMPPKAAALRAEQLAWLSKEGHIRQTDTRIGELLDILEGFTDLNEVQSANVRLARESYDKATKLPTEFVTELTKHNSKSLISWTEAREKNDFSRGGWALTPARANGARKCVAGPAKGSNGGCF